MMKEKTLPLSKGDPLLLSVFANRLKCSVSKARGMVRRREIDSIKVGRQILVPEYEAERLLNDGYRPRQTVGEPK